MNIEWSDWAKVSRWLDVGLNAEPQIPECDGLYEIRTSPEYGHRLRVYGLYRPRLRGPGNYHPYVEGGRVLYVGKSCAKAETKKDDNFTGLSKRVGAFIMSAMGLGTEHRSAGRRLYDLRAHVTVRDVEVRWAVVDCPRCAERIAFNRNKPRPLFNQTAPTMCGSKGCPYYSYYCRPIKLRPIDGRRSL